MAVVIHHELHVVTGRGKVGEDMAILRARTVEGLVRLLSARGAEQSDRCGAAIAGCAAEILEDVVETTEQRVVAHADHVKVIP